MIAAEYLIDPVLVGLFCEQGYERNKDKTCQHGCYTCIYGGGEIVEKHIGYRNANSYGKAYPYGSSRGPFPIESI